MYFHTISDLLYIILFQIRINRQIKKPLIYILIRGDKFAFANTGELRIDNDIKQGVIAKILNVDQSTYSRYEKGILDIPRLSLIKLAEFYKTSTDYLLRSH